MKLINFLICFFCLGILLLALVSCMTNNMAYVSKDYEIYGTWVNTDYYDEIRAGVRVFYPNNLYETYATLEKEKIHNRYWNGVTGKWKDRKGNIWYTTITILGDKSWYYELVKISNNGKTLESLGSADDYPKEINSMNIGYDYAIYYRE